VLTIDFALLTLLLRVETLRYSFILRCCDFEHWQCSQDEYFARWIWWAVQMLVVLPVNIVVAETFLHERTLTF